MRSAALLVIFRRGFTGGTSENRKPMRRPGARMRPRRARWCGQRALEHVCQRDELPYTCTLDLGLSRTRRMGCGT